MSEQAGMGMYCILYGGGGGGGVSNLQSQIGTEGSEWFCLSQSPLQ